MHPEDVDIERLIQDLDEGLLEEYGAPHGNISSQFGYRIFYGDVELQCGQKFSYYGIHQNPTITVMLDPTSGSSGA